MATAEDFLKKAEARRKNNGKKFQPVRRRAWDYLTVDDKNGLKNEQKTVAREQDKSRYEYRDDNRNKISTDIETDIGTNGYEYRDDNRNKISTDIESNIGTENRYDILQQNVHLAEKFPAKKPVEHKESEENKIIQILRKTTGYQKEVMQQITAHIKSLPDNANTIDIPIDTLSIRIKTSKDITRTSIKRLQKKSILLKEKGERGRLGSTQVTIPNFILRACLNLFICPPKSLYEIGNENGYEYRDDGTVYSSSLYINNTTTNLELPEDWLKINVTPLSDIGFSSTQIKQLYTQALNTPEVIQESINHFAFGLKNNPKLKEKYREPLNVLMGVLRKGGVWIENNYESLQDIAQRQIIEQKKIERERRKQLEEDALKLALEDWKDSLSKKELEQITAKDNPKDIMPSDTKLRIHFKEIIWPNLKKDYLINSHTEE